MSILYKERDLVVPGEVIAEGDFRSGEGTFKDGKKVIANVLGLVNVKEKRISIIPLQGRYNPKEGDIVIGLVIDSTPRSWKVDIKSPWYSILPLNNAVNRRYSNRDENHTALFSAGDYILARVVSFDRVMGPALSILERGLGKLRKGRVVNIAPSKIPRFIGRKQSMIEMIEHGWKKNFPYMGCINCRNQRSDHQNLFGVRGTQRIRYLYSRKQHRYLQKEMCRR